jgi:hypothetical protein
MQDPNTSKRIMASIGPKKGRNQVLREARILFVPIPELKLEFQDIVSGAI